jgi:hypothetical protein
VTEKDPAVWLRSYLTCQYKFSWSPPDTAQDTPPLSTYAGLLGSFKYKMLVLPPTEPGANNDVMEPFSVAEPNPETSPEDILSIVNSPVMPVMGVVLNTPLAIPPLLFEKVKSKLCADARAALPNQPASATPT